MPRLNFTDDEANELLKRSEKTQAQLHRDISISNAAHTTSPIFAPFNLAEAAGSMVYNNLAMPTLNAMGLSRKGTIAEDFTFDRENMVSPDMSLSGIYGLLGGGRSSGFTRSNTGESIDRDITHGSALSSVLASKNRQGLENFGSTTAGQVALTLGDIGVDPLTWIGMGSGLEANFKANSIKRMVTLMRRIGKEAGVADNIIENSVKAAIRSKLGKEPTLMQALIGMESPHDFFRKGILFNRNPVANYASKVDDILGVAPKADTVPVGETPALKANYDQRVTDILGSARTTTRSNIEEILNARRVTEQLGQTRLLRDVMSGEQMLEEAMKMTRKHGLYGEYADDIAQTAIMKTYENLGDKAVDESLNAVGKVRNTLKHKIQNAIRDVKRHPGGMTGIPEDANVGVTRFDDIFEGAEQTAFSLTERATGNQSEAVEYLRNRAGLKVNQTAEGMELLTADGRKAIINTPEVIESAETGKNVAGRQRIRMDGVGEIELTKLANKQTADHELIHWARGMNRFSVGEWNQLVNKYAPGLTDLGKIEEAVADGLSANATEHAGIIQRIKEFFVKLYESVTGSTTLTGTEARWRKGDIFTRSADATKKADIDNIMWHNKWNRLLKRMDATTGILDKTPLRKQIAKEMKDPENTWFVFDIDRFKAVNEVFGHDGGDAALADIGSLVTKYFPDRLHGRFGGEEFVVKINPGDESRIAEFMNAVPQEVKVGGESITISGGVAKGGEVKSLQKMKLKADEIGTEAKRQGRNRIGIDKGGEVEYIQGRDVGGRDYVRQYLEMAVRENIADLQAEKAKAGSSDMALNIGLRESGADTGRLVERPGGMVQRAPARNSSDVLSQDWKYSHTPADIPDNNSALARATKRGHVRGIFDQGDEPKGFVDLLKSKEGRSELFLRVKEKGWDELARVRKAMFTTAGGKTHFKGKASAHILLQNLSGLLSHTKHVLENGISLNKKYLWKGDMVQAINEPMRKYLQKVNGRVLAKDAEQFLAESDAYLVSRRAVSLYNQAINSIDTALETGLDASNPLVYRKILSADDVNSIKRMTDDEAIQFMRGKAESWARSNTGLADPESGISDLDMARDIIREVEADKDKMEAFSEIQKTVSEINEAKLRYVHGKGMITDSELESMLEMSDDYAPLNRILEESTNGQAAGSGSDLIKTLKGSQREILNPVTSTIESTVNWMRRADINEVFQRWFTDTDIEDLADLGIRRVEQGAEGNVKQVFINGEKTYWKFEDEDLYKSIERIGRAEPQDTFTKILVVYKKVVRESVTHSPGFPIRNFIRDSFMRAITSEHNTGLLAGFERINPEDIDDMIWAGGDQAGFYGKVSKAYGDRMRESIKAVAKDDKTVIMRMEDAGNMIKGAWDKYGDFLSKGEIKNRLAEFNAARRELKAAHPGMVDFEIDRIAAYKARDLMDFALIGEWGRKINNFVPFFNPAVQGTVKIIRTARKDPAKFTKRLMKYVGMPSIGCYLYNKSVGADKEYRNLPAYRRDLYWNFKVGDRWLVIPKPFEAGVLGTSFERIIDYAESGDKAALQGVLPSMERGDMGTLIKSASPVDEALLAGPFRPALEILMNKDLFRDRYIIPPHEEGLDPRLRKGVKDASGVGKALSAISGTAGVMSDPRQWDYLVRGLFGEYGRMATDFTKTERKNTVHNLTGGFVRKTSPWALQGVQDAMKEANTKGLNRKKEHKAFIDSIRKTAANPTTPKINEILRKAERERKRLSRTSIDDILKKRK